MSHRSLDSLSTLLAALSLAAVQAAPSDAAVTFYRWFKTANYIQTSNVQPLTSHYYGDVDVIFDNPLDLTGGTVTSSSSFSPMHLSKSSPTFANYEMTFTFLAGLDVNFPNSSSYSYNILGGLLGNQSASLTPPPSDLFPTAGQIQFERLGDNTLNSVLISAHTLAPGTTYDLDLVYDNRIDAAGAGFTNATSEIAFDTRTDITFTTSAVPEPSTAALLVIGCVVALIARRR
jgi:hypothetical protein